MKIYKMHNSDFDYSLNLTLDPYQQYSHLFDEIEGAQEYLGALPSFCFPQLPEHRGLPLHLLAADKYGMPTYDLDINLDELTILGDEGESDLAPYALVNNPTTQESMAIYPYALVVFFKSGAFVRASRMD